MSRHRPIEMGFQSDMSLYISDFGGMFSTLITMCSLEN